MPEDGGTDEDSETDLVGVAPALFSSTKTSHSPSGKLISITDFGSALK